MLSGDTAGVFPGEEIGDSYRVVRAVGGSWTPLRLFVAVPALPKGCAVELQPLCAVATSAAADNSSAASDSDGDDVAQGPGSSLTRRRVPLGLRGMIFLMIARRTLKPGLERKQSFWPANSPDRVITGNHEARLCRPQACMPCFNDSTTAVMPRTTRRDTKRGSVAEGYPGGRW